MTSRTFITAVGFILSILVHGQSNQLLTLDYCQQQAVVNYPSFKQYELLQNASDLEVKNLGKNWLPALNLNGQASYQSDVTKVPAVIPQFAVEPISKDWYKLYLDVSQVIWDGGATKQGKSVEDLDHQIDVKNLEIELYKLKEQVNGLYFSILLLQENRTLLQNHSDVIQKRLLEMESAIRNGLVLASNASILKAESLKVEQKIEELDLARATALQSLSILIGQEIPADVILQMPSPEIDLSMKPEKRLEYGLFELQNRKMDVLKKMSGTSLLPKFQAFGQAGLGRPAFDMLDNDLTDFYIIGVRMNWNFWNWNKTRNEKSILEIHQQIVDSKRDAFSKNLSLEMENKRSEVLKYEQYILKDQEILDLRSQVVKEYSSRLSNGVITATEYLTELNAESEAKLNINIHKIQLVQAKYKYLAALGQL